MQIAEDSEHNAYAMKFFLSRPAFQHEKSLYLDHSQPMQQMLPRLTRVVEEGDMCDMQGLSMPPLIVMEKGESLDVWLKTSGSLDRVGCLQVCTWVAFCTSDNQENSRRPVTSHGILVFWILVIEFSDALGFWVIPPILSNV